MKRGEQYQGASENDPRLYPGCELRSRLLMARDDNDGKEKDKWPECRRKGGTLDYGRQEMKNGVFGLHFASEAQRKTEPSVG